MLSLKTGRNLLALTASLVLFNLFLASWAWAYQPILPSWATGRWFETASYAKIRGDAQTYRVRSGDSLWRIARRFDTDVWTLTEVNRLNDDTLLRIGQVLRLPTPGEKLHLVRRGENLWEIAREHGVNLEDLQALNNLQHPDKLHEGQELRLPPAAKRLNTRKVAIVASRQTAGPEFDWPYRGTITSGYGERSGGFHHGLDIAGDLGDPIRAATGGRVMIIDSNRPYGRFLEINHDNGYQTLYGHASKILVDEGAEVQAGEKIAEIGNTGNSTGPHLHFEIRLNGEAINPLPYLQ